MEILSLQDEFLITGVTSWRPSVAQINCIKVRLASESNRIFIGCPRIDITMHPIGAKTPATIVTDIAAYPPKCGPSAETTYRAAKREVIASKDAATNFSVGIRRQHVGNFSTVIIEQLV